MMRNRCKTILVLGAALLAADTATAQEPDAGTALAGHLESEVSLGPAPILQYPETAIPFGEVVATRAAGLAVDSQNRTAVASFYKSFYTPALSTPIGWSGNIAGCVAGTTSQAYVDATMQIINYFRAMAGLPGNIVHQTALTAGVQEAALMMIAEGGLSHSPPPTWACYTSAGASAAGRSNLAIGNTGPSAMVAYVRDSGSFNTAVGHRRWILWPPQAGMASGSNNGVSGFFFGANALNVFASFTTRPSSPSVVAWPPPGFVPYQVVYSRWSMSLNSVPGADYSSATVTMTLNGSNVPLTVVSRIDNGFGDNTIVWEPTGLAFGAGQDDQTITVTVGNIGGSPQVTYDVTVIDPAQVSDEIFAGSFESGSTSRWSATR